MEMAVTITGTLKMYKAPVKSPAPTYQLSYYMPDALPVTQPTQSKHWKVTSLYQQEAQTSLCTKQPIKLNQ